MCRKTKTYVLWGLLALVALSSCSPRKRSAEDSERRARPEVADTTLFARLDAVTGDSLSLTQVGHDRRLSLSVAECRDKGHLAGDLTTGDTLAIIARQQEKKVLSAVNVTQVAGLWFIDGKGGNGLRLTSDGAASWIGDEDVTLRSWRIGNGKFILNYIKADGSDYREIPDTAEIQQLDSEHLTVVFKDKTLQLTRSKGLITLDDIKKN